jgi:hypothetical protein
MVMVMVIPRTAVRDASITGFSEEVRVCGWKINSLTLHFITAEIVTVQN